jgi:acetolactate synthase-1/3 small subunit
VLVENQPGVLNKVASLFRRRGMNIESLSVGPTEDHEVSRMTITVDVGRAQADQAVKQLYKIIEVIKVSDITEDPVVDRELMLVKVGSSRGDRADLLHVVELFGARVLDVGSDTLILELSGNEDQVDTFLEMLRSFGIKEVTRSGACAMVRGGRALKLVKESTAPSKPLAAARAGVLVGD